MSISLYYAVSIVNKINVTVQNNYRDFRSVLNYTLYITKGVGLHYVMSIDKKMQALKALATISQLGDINVAYNDIRRVLAERSLYQFIKQGWRYIDPAPFVDGWHIQAICSHLEAVLRGELRHLIINMPPRCMKSSSVSVALCPWSWCQPTIGSMLSGQQGRPPHPPYLGSHAQGVPSLLPPHLGPKTSFMYASYGQTLSMRDSVKSRRLIDSPWYQQGWGKDSGEKKRFLMSDDSNTKTRFDNSEGGYRIATSVGGSLTGEGADVILLDDPHNAVDIESDAVREGVLSWYRESMSTRLNNPKTGSYIVVMQRLHDRDLVGDIMANAKADGDWTLLRLPMEYEPKWHCSTKLPWSDPRGLDEEGELLEGLVEGSNGLLKVLPGSPMEEAEGRLLWPARFGKEEVDNLKRVLGPAAASGQLQQNPVPRGGAIIKEEWWQMFPPKGDEEVWTSKKWNGEEYTPVVNFPPMEYIIVYADTAYTEAEENDYSAAAMIGVWRDKNENAKLMLMRCWQERMELHKLVNKLAQTCRLGKNSFVDKLIIENKASGKSVAQEIIRLFGNENWMTQTADPARGDKVARAYSIQYLFADKMVYAPARDWADMAIRETSIFPKGAHDDLPDAIFGGIRWLRDNGYIEMRRERIIQETDTATFKGNKTGSVYDC